MYLAVDFQGGVESAWSNVATFVPKLVAALVIVVVGWIVAKAVASILNTVLERVGFDRVVERGGVRQVLARSKYDPSDILAKLVFWTILLFVLQLAFGVFGTNLGHRGVRYRPQPFPRPLTGSARGSAWRIVALPRPPQPLAQASTTRQEDAHARPRHSPQLAGRHHGRP